MIPLFPAINLMPMPKTTEELPRRTLAAKAIRLHLLGEIALDYADTVLNIATRIRNPATKALCRTTKEVCLDYERFRQATSDPDQRRTEKRFGEDFEAICEPHLKKLSDGLSVEIDRLGLDKEYAALVKAVQMAMTVIDAMRLYAHYCDRWIERGGVNGRTILYTQFSQLSTLLPQFAGDSYTRDSSARTITAKIIYNELKQLELYDDYGTI